MSLNLTTIEAINEAREALRSGLEKGMWSREEYKMGMANMAEAEAVLKLRAARN
jgi:hypothetical protein